TLIDSVVQLGGDAAGGTGIEAEKSFYMRNVYVQHAGAIVEGVRGNADGWARINELAFPIQPAPFKGITIAEPIYLNGRRQTVPYVKVANAKPPPDSLRSRHLWTAHFPSWQDGNAVNVKAPPYSAAGDGTTDDTAALQKAVDENEIVFLPKGYYRLTDTLRLKPNSKLIGVAHHLSTIIARPPYGALGKRDTARPLVETADTANAETIIAFVGIMLFPEAPEETVERHGGMLPFSG
ncbi:MAG: hypothetical protein HN380_33080, partial [Victivallales bacterium]|nr:hypothetical protein [Victivallales bacterium]